MLYISVLLFRFSNLAIICFLILDYFSVCSPLFGINVSELVLLVAHCTTSSLQSFDIGVIPNVTSIV